MSIALGIFSVVLIAISIYGVVLPLKLTVFVRSFMTGPGVWGAVLVRLLMAIILWFSAPVSHTPIIFKGLAFLALMAAVLLPIIGAPRLIKLIDRLASWPPLVIRLQCLLGVAFGVFLLWSVSPGLGVI